jgi:hypothetical protein
MKNRASENLCSEEQKFVVSNDSDKGQIVSAVSQPLHSLDGIFK